MLSKDDHALIEKLAQTIGSSAEFVVQQYSNWFVASAICLIVVGLSFFVLAIKIKFTQDSDIPPGGQLAIRFAIAFIGMLFLASNIADLASPQAAAVHQLLKDIRSND